MMMNHYFADPEGLDLFIILINSLYVNLSYPLVMPTIKYHNN